MSRLEEMKERYDRTPIPEELNIRIQQEILKSQKQWEEKRQADHRRWFKRTIRGVGAAAAAACILFTTALNTSPVFATEAAQLPVVGELDRILTFRSYQTEEDDIAISVEIPTIEMIAEDTGITVDEINQEILARCNQYADAAMLRAKEYRTAFLDTGGTPEEWALHNIKITVRYEIKRQSKDFLSFVVIGAESWVSAYNEFQYYNLDLNTGELVTLKDILGDNYVELVNESIRKQIYERQKAGEPFFTEEEGGFAGISDDTKFYINESGNAVIVFEKYEIAPGSSGEIEFEIGEETEDDVQKTDQTTERYEDNFAVDSEAVEEFAEKVKDAVEAKDLEALAELTAFPVYVGLPDVGTVESKEAFIRLGAEKIFTDGLSESVKASDCGNFEPCMAGFSISDGGTANINFGVVDGELAVNGINY